MTRPAGPLVIGLGEALFDCFPDHQVLGGAPINLVVHLNALLQPHGGQALPLTRVGDDPLGIRFFDELSDRGVDTVAVQTDPHEPTGVVEVHASDEGETHYCFAPNMAWDRLVATTDGHRLVACGDAICFGTLAQRRMASRHAIQSLLASATDSIRLLDVNLRQDFFSRQVLHESLQAATAAKLNAQELLTVSEQLGLAADPELLAQEYELDWVAVTHGERGTSLHHRGEVMKAVVPKFAKAPAADSVGAGDACAAGLLYGVLRSWDWPPTVELANRLGAYVASQPGATPALPAELIPGVTDD